MALLRSLRMVLHRSVPLVRHPRAHARVMMSEPIRLRTDWSHEQQGMLEDISVGGACVRTHVRMRPGDTVGLMLSLGVGRRFDARAKVVYAVAAPSGYQTRYGMRFVGLSPERESEINHFVVEQKFGRQFGVRPGASATERSSGSAY